MPRCRAAAAIVEHLPNSRPADALKSSSCSISRDRLGGPCDCAFSNNNRRGGNIIIIGRENKLISRCFAPLVRVEFSKTDFYLLLGIQASSPTANLRPSYSNISTTNAHVNVFRRKVCDGRKEANRIYNDSQKKIVDGYKWCAKPIQSVVDESTCSYFNLPPTHCFPAAIGPIPFSNRATLL